jgi:hypothetical protein
MKGSSCFKVKAKSRKLQTSQLERDLGVDQFPESNATETKKMFPEFFSKFENALNSIPRWLINFWLHRAEN